MDPAYLRFFWGTRWLRYAVAVLSSVETVLKYCETRPPDAASGQVVTFIEPAF